MREPPLTHPHACIQSRRRPAEEGEAPADPAAACIARHYACLYVGGGAPTAIAHCTTRYTLLLLLLLLLLLRVTVLPLTLNTREPEHSIFVAGVHLPNRRVPVTTPTFNAENRL